MCLNGFANKIEFLEINLIRYSCIVIEFKIDSNTLNARVTDLVSKQKNCSNRV